MKINAWKFMESVNHQLSKLCHTKTSSTCCELYTKPLISCLQNNSLHKLIKRIIKKRENNKKNCNFKHCHPYTNGPHVLWMKFYIILWLVELMVGEKNKRVFLFLCFTHFISVKRISVEFGWLFTLFSLFVMWCDVNNW